MTNKFRKKKHFDNSEICIRQRNDLMRNMYTLTEKRNKKKKCDTECLKSLIYIIDFIKSIFK